jgi:type IV pilus biogenesis protein CpaD/CtpE
MMTRATRFRRGAAFAPLAFVLALAACEPSGDEMGTKTGPMPQAPPQVVVRDQERHLDVELRGNAAIDAREWARIDRFLGNAAPGRPDTVRLVIAGDASPGAIDLIIRHAFAMGYAENKIKVAPPDHMPGGRAMRVELTTNVSVAILPNCPQTQHLNIIDGENQVASDWGCATVSMIELQVADPHDLVRGEGGGQTDSVITTAAIRRLETDKVKKLDAPTSTSSVAGGGGGGGQ